MENVATKISETTGLAPGTIVPIGIDESAPSKFIVSLIKEGDVSVERLGSLNDALPDHPEGTTLWIDVQSYAGITSIKKIFKALDIHPLFQEDIMNTRQREKFEILDKAILIIAKRLIHSANGRIHPEQITFLMKGNVIVTFQPATGDSFTGVRKRLSAFKENKTLPGYVLYALLDNLVDTYFGVMERLQAAIEKTEKQLLLNETSLDRETLNGLKHDILIAHHVIWPMKGIIGKFSADQEDVFPPNMDPYLYDLKDHIEQLDEAREICKEGVDGIIQLNMDNLNVRTNEIMKTLALISTVFLPLTFIAGVYGMNFSFMPELKSPWGYPAVLGLMAIIALFLYQFFKNRHWME